MQNYIAMTARPGPTIPELAAITVAVLGIYMKGGEKWKTDMPVLFSILLKV